MADLKAFVLTFTDATDLAAAGENIELSSFGEGEAATEVKDMQNGLNNLRDLLKGDLADIRRFITNPPSGLADFKRIAAQFGVGGTIIGVTGVSLNYIIHYGDHKNGNNDNNNNNDNNDNRGDQNKATASATSSTSTATATPLSWLFNTVPGTSRESFEDFVSKLPDGGSGIRIIFPRQNYQNYVTEMTLEEAKAVSKEAIIDQMGLDAEMMDLDSDGPQSIRQQHERRTPPGTEVVYQGQSPLHLRMISFSKDKKISDLNEFNPDISTQYAFDASAGSGSYVYVLDCGFDWDHPVSIILSIILLIFKPWSWPCKYLILEPQTRLPHY